MDSSALIDRLGSFSAETLKNDAAARKEALGLSRMLTSSLQEPLNETTEIMISPLVLVAIRIGVDLNIFKNVVDSGEPVETKILADKAGGDVELVYRIARFLGSIGYLNEVSPGIWGPTPVTKAMASDAISAGHKFIYDCIVVSGIKAPQYLRESKFRAPVEHTDAIVQFAHHTKLPIFEYIASSPHLLDNFNIFMGATMGARVYWTDWYPIQERLLDGAQEDKKLLVDVAGGKGHDLQLFLDKFPKTKGLVLQEIPQALEAATEDILDPIVERMEYDFFSEQPIKGARAYFMHHIIHDWPEKQCLDILAKLHDAMTPGYSRLLIHDLILPDHHANTVHCMYDMAMLSFNGGKERSRSQWTQLLNKAGFEIVKLWVDDENADGLVEAVRK